MVKKVSKNPEPVKNDEMIEIPVGKYLEKVRQNPWIIVSVVLALALIVSIFVGGSSGEIISADEAGAKVVNFVTAQGGTASLVSSTREGNLYKVVVDYQAEEIPVYTTLDGNFLISSLIPLNSDGSNAPTNSAMGTPEQTSEDDDAFIGDENAPIVIIEFSDYQCPYCKAFWEETLPSIKTDYVETGKVKLVYRDYPLDIACNPSLPRQMHPDACKAAEAAECAREKGGDAAYFKMHDKLFENQATLSVANYKKWAKEIGYNIDSCLDSGKFADEVEADVVAGGSLGTPAFFVNGVKIEGALPYTAFKQIIDAELAKVGA